MAYGFIEGCVDSHASALAACRGGADRLELCANLSIGGTTPSPGLFQLVRRDCSLPVNVLIRPRFGDFLYDRAEIEEMEDCVRRFRDLGADGVVLGALTRSGTLDEAVMARLIRAAGDMAVTLHRAFDMTRDPLESLEAAAALGCRTILTSGQERDALAGAETLRALREKAAGRMEIMAGCGVRKENIRELHRRTGVHIFHTSGRRGPVDSGMIYRKPTVSMGLPSLPEYELWRTDEEEFRACAEMVHGLAPLS
ncbi:copper homeostasis protein CutC [Oscillibacter sp.]|uniref:copper homeostasis protein CutC n=1 Tax=Oscillibacter sp. TaxID=1945593 RepID=UPI002D7E4B91|nr:copper homeostasis protein CutC [Oscillibacter sp.]